MSYTFTLSGKESVLSTTIYPPIVLNENEQYVLGLINFESYNSIPNVDSSNNVFHYGENQQIVIPEGSYEIGDIQKYLTGMIRLLTEKKRSNHTPYGG